MAVSGDYSGFVRDLLADFEPLRIKRMFGGAGIYSGKTHGIDPDARLAARP